MAPRWRGASRMVAKVDSAAVQDGFDLYLHGFIVADDGKWVVVQQGMNGEHAHARRYHWLSEGLAQALSTRPTRRSTAKPGRDRQPHRFAALRPRVAAQLDLLRDLGPSGVAREAAALEAQARRRPARAGADAAAASRSARASRGAGRWTSSAPGAGALAAAADSGPKDFADLLMVPGVGARTVRALALVAEVVHGAPCRFSDPARFSLAHGGKDRHPFPVATRVYDETI